MTKGTHLLRSALLALLALAVISGGSLAAGDLFDDDYKDCPYKTRLRDGQIDDLSVNRDSDDEDHVNVSWTATDPATWGLGSNAYRTSLVVILDDGDPNTETLSLGSKKTTFEGVETGREVQVQMAIVVDTADGKYLISDILEQSINQSLTKPAFMTDVVRVTAAAITANSEATPPVVAVAEKYAKTKGTLYYVGYNENFGNYKANTYSFSTNPDTARLRIGLANTELDSDGNRYASDKGPYDDVDFDAYIVRITDEDGDVVPEGDDIATRASDYGANRLIFGTFDTAPTTDTGVFSNVRINDGGEIRASVQDGGPVPGGAGATLTTATAVTAAGVTGLSYVAPSLFVAGPVGADIAANTATGAGAANTIYALPPSEYRDFPIDVLSSDETYTFTAWAVNDDDEVISPVASLKVRPIDEAVTITSGALADYTNAGTLPDNADVVAGTGDSIYVTEFTVLK